MVDCFYSAFRYCIRRGAFHKRKPLLATRCLPIAEFLGASNPNHELLEDGWTGFTDSDDEDLKALWDDHWERCLYPVINATLNVVDTNRLAWQERKGGAVRVHSEAYGLCAARL